LSSVVEIKDMQFRYPSNPDPTLKIKDFKLNTKERVFLYGPSGTGKSTFLEVLAGILLPQSGEVKILNQDLMQMPAAGRDRFRAQHLGYIFQSFNLLPFLSLRENILLPLSLSEARRNKVKDAEAEVQFLLEKLGLLGVQYKKVRELSVGQQQRVAVARALLGAPELILADEPTSSLDYDHRERFLNLMFELAEDEGSTILFVSHDRTLEKMFDRSLSLTEINSEISGAL
jgi:putative ABC transport system ATP-binding protein